MIATAATATGVDRAIRHVANESEAVADFAVRFVEVRLIELTFNGAPTYLTPTDVLALATGSIVVVRFGAWLLSPLVPLICKRLRRDGESSDP